MSSDRRAPFQARGPASVSSLLSNSPLLSERSAHISLADWGRALGDRLAQKTHPERITDGVLTVRVPSSTWAQELSLLSDVVLERLRSSGHPVSKLRFHVAAGRTPPEPKVTHVRRVPLPAELAESLARLDDPELRDAIADAASLNLAREGR